MKLTFIGTGEAFDTQRGNYSCLIENNGKSIMVDCGYKAPYSLRRILKKEGKSILEVPDTLLYTHFHGDHFGGTTALIIPMGDEIAEYNEKNSVKRKRFLNIVSAHEDAEERFVKRMNEDYPGLLEHFSNRGLEIRYDILNQEDILEGLSVNFAQTQHSVKNYAYKFTDKNGKSLAISGDGAFTKESKRLFKYVDCLVHEGFFLDHPSETHASIEDVVNFSVEAQIPNVAIVHVNQTQRKEGYETNRINSMINYAKQEGVNLFLPNDEDAVNI